MSKLKINTIYQAIIQLVTSAESITWSRFNNFLIANSIIILAWSSIYNFSPSDTKEYVLIILSALGIIGSIIWLNLNLRGRKFLEEYILIGSEIENKYGEKLDNNFLILNKTKSLAKNLPFKVSSSKYILSFWAICFLIVYILLFFISYL